MQARCRLFAALVAAGCLANCVLPVQGQEPATGAATEKGSGITLVSAGAEPRHQLIYRFQPGHFTHYEVTHKMAMTTQYQAITQNVKNESTAWKQFRVVTVDEQGNALLEPVVQRVVMSAQFDEEPPVACDSDKPDEAAPEFAQVMATIKKPVAQVKVSPQGELLQVTLLAGASSGMLANSNRADPQLNFLTVVPAEAVGVGASWRERYEIPVMVDAQLSQRVTLQRTYEITEITGKLVTMSLKTVVITPVSDPQISMQLMQRTPSGTLQFDMEQGRIVLQKLAVSKTVVGAIGPQSQVTSSTETMERLVAPGQTTAAAPKRLE